MNIFLKIMACLFVIVPTLWAIHMYQVQGDERWFLTIIGAPIMGAILWILGCEFDEITERY